jgi:4-amino-4-deoxy-L-arabinose transferase-like glycosyltransferase
MATNESQERLNWGLTPIVWDGTRTPLKTALFVVVCFAYLLPGLVGHDPWKYDEAVIFGVVSEIMRTGDWTTFRVAGEPFLDKAPLFIWVSAAFAKAFGAVLPLHDAARLASGFFMAATLAFLSAASLEVMGQRGVRLGVLLFIGCLGLLIRAHEMIADLAGLAGVAMGLYGLALASRRPKAGGAVTGAAMGLAYLGNGLLPVVMLATLLAVLPAASPLWRKRPYALTAAIAIAAAIPFLAAWPAQLAWGDSMGRGGMDLLYLFRALPWYAWPALPLAAWTLWHARGAALERQDVMLPLLAFVSFFLAGSVFGEPRDVTGLAMLLPVAMLGVAELDNLPRGAASALDWFGMTTFLSLGAVVWILWVAAMTGSPELAAQWLAREVPGYKHRFNFLAFSLALLLTLIWIVVVARSLRSTRRALVNWTTGITMVWMLVMTLGLPMVDYARSYRGISSRVVEELPKDFACVARRNVGDAQRALLDYFVNLRMVRDDSAAAARCKALLVQAAPLKIPAVGPDWTETWRGSRPGDRNELFILYRRE